MWADRLRLLSFFQHLSLHNHCNCVWYRTSRLPGHCMASDRGHSHSSLQNALGSAIILGNCQPHVSCSARSNISFSAQWP
ncbi:hypothetical protein FIBSPDRAFT_38448 [Athelia psychrophila]|uniref:Uncharacterized protein n=1 Tax=Athelia psychrophila TaxID=1759441 RepID=A0A166FJP5_9AGAM|nr:hypothetical protein FIBSPDRAFT_38448 [Fibularhizoctonia sp. CBS 109695]